VSLVPFPAAHPHRLIQDRLLWLAAAFLLFFSLALTLAPTARLHSMSAPLNWLHWSGFAAWSAGFFLIHREMGRVIPEADPYLLPAAALLTGWGLLTIWRLDVDMGARQTIWLVVGVFLARGALRTPDLLERLRRYKYLWLITGLLITAATFIFGTYPGGTGPRLWLGCCGVYLQPSEPLKLLLVIYLAAYLADRLPVSFSLFGLFGPTLILIGAATGLLLAQRDLGTASLMIAIYTLTLYLASGRRRMLLLSLAAISAAALAGYQLFNVVQVRFNAWINPWTDPSGHSFQIIQSLIAFASGGVFGRGPGLGSPGVVPVAHSDFIFAAIGEETGLLGVTAVLILYALLIGRGLKLALATPMRYQRYLAAGISAYFTAQSILIAGGTVRLLPLTGATLPFVSYGGSSLLTAMAALLLLISTSSQPEDEPAPLLRPHAFRLISWSAAVGMLALGGFAAWWMLIRQEALVNRPDNPRPYINERFILRGSILDRNNQVLVESIGLPGEIERNYVYPPFSLVSGYNSPLLGQSGLEASLDAYLRGRKGTPSSLVWWNALVYGQPPTGLDVRLSIDIDFQKLADDLLADHTGAVVLLNARSGEVLTMSSQPGFDANQIANGWDSDPILSAWEDLKAKTDAPLLNRAAQGQYLPGPSLGAFLLVESIERASLPELPTTLMFSAPSGPSLNCSMPLDAISPLDWGTVIRAGCPQPLVDLSNQFLPAQLDDLFTRLGFYKAPVLPIPTAPEDSPSAAVERTDLAAVGIENLNVSPLQMALAASAISAGGKMPEPVLASAVHTPNQGWVILPVGPSTQAFSASSAAAAANAMAQPGEFFWQVLARAELDTGTLTWYLAGTLPKWQGTPLAVAVVLEEDNLELAQEIGQSLLRTAVK
jgi:cell division protein FtsW (lipid II flippase)